MDDDASQSTTEAKKKITAQLGKCHYDSELISQNIANDHAVETGFDEVWAASEWAMVDFINPEGGLKEKKKKRIKDLIRLKKLYFKWVKTTKPWNMHEQTTRRETRLDSSKRKEQKRGSKDVNSSLMRENGKNVLIQIDAIFRRVTKQSSSSTSFSRFSLRPPGNRPSD